MTTLKSTSRRQGWKGDQPSEGSRSANLRANGQKQHIRPNPRASQHRETKPVRIFWGMVNAVVVQGKIIPLPREICLSRLLNRGGETVPSKVAVNMAEVSRRREPGDHSRERSEGSVIRRYL